MPNFAHIAGLMVAALPSILSTSLGLGAALAAVNAFSPGPVEVRELRAGWGAPLRAAGLRVKESPSRGNRTLVEVSEVTYGAGLWHLMQATGTVVDQLILYSCYQVQWV